MVKVINKRPGGFIYHYGHFIMDCLFPEIIAKVFANKNVVRVKSLQQTIGNLDKIYERIMGVKNIEVPQAEFDKIKGTPIHIYRINYPTIIQLNAYRTYIFNRFNIDPQKSLVAYPEIILIKRGWKPLLEGKGFDRKGANTGAKRREIFDIEKLELFLKRRYGKRFQAVVLEELSYKKQILYFNNAKYIIGIHGAALANMLYCKRGTKLIEVLDKVLWDWQFVNSCIYKLGCSRVTSKNKYNHIVNTIRLNIPHGRVGEN